MPALRRLYLPLAHPSLYFSKKFAYVVTQLQLPFTEKPIFTTTIVSAEPVSHYFCLLWFLSGYKMSQGKDNARLKSYKNKSLNTDEMRRRREEEGLQLRKQKKDEQVRMSSQWMPSFFFCFFLKNTFV